MIVCAMYIKVQLRNEMLCYIKSNNIKHSIRLTSIAKFNLSKRDFFLCTDRELATKYLGILHHRAYKAKSILHRESSYLISFLISVVCRSFIHLDQIE